MTFRNVVQIGIVVSDIERAQCLFKHWEAET